MKIQDIIEAHGNSKIYDKCWTGYKKVPGKKRGEEGSCEKIGEGLNEMDKSAPQPGRDGKVSHSTYGSRDKKGSDYFKGKEAPGKPITKKEMEKYALDILKKQGVAEGLDADQKKAKQVPSTEMPKKTSPVLGKAPKQHPFKGRAVGGGL